MHTCNTQSAAHTNTTSTNTAHHTYNIPVIPPTTDAIAIDTINTIGLTQTYYYYNPDYTSYTKHTRSNHHTNSTDNAQYTM